MQIDRIIYPTTALGPGNRVVIWVVGCSKQCKKCSNKELWKKNVEKELSVEEIHGFIKSIAEQRTIDGITLTGGDPLEQDADEVLELLQKLRSITKDILLYTGYTWEELEEVFSEEQLEVLKQTVAVLIDGRYEDELNDNKVVLRGSANQRIFFLREEERARYEPYMAEGRKIQNLHQSGKMISIGIHNKEGNGYG